jgi:hypothetical protein
VGEKKIPQYVPDFVFLAVVQNPNKEKENFQKIIFEALLFKSD